MNELFILAVGAVMSVFGLVMSLDILARALARLFFTRNRSNNVTRIAAVRRDSDIELIPPRPDT